MNRILQHRRTPFLFAFVASLGLVFGGVLLAEFLRLAACPLCIIQRTLYLLLAVVAGIGIAVAARPLAPRFAALAMVLTAATGIFVAGYQVWIQRFAPATNCSPYPTWWEEMVERAGEVVPILFKASGLCSDPAWKFLGLSIADWSLCWFSLFLLVALYALMRKR
ncbi:MAG: disulfide bond formation protein B [Rhodocyclales bacterium]|nr:disulfide bond formation protein B [Rhodocyclales bacterium]